MQTFNMRHQHMCWTNELLMFFYGARTPKILIKNLKCGQGKKPAFSKSQRTKIQDCPSKINNKKMRDSRQF